MIFWLPIDFLATLLKEAHGPLIYPLTWSRKSNNHPRCCSTWKETLKILTGEERNSWECLCAINLGLLLTVKTKPNQANIPFQIKTL